MTLFTDELPIVTTDEELTALKTRYATYDEYYIASGAIADRRPRFEELWKLYQPHADRHFLSEVKKQFHQRTWEMYVGCALLKNKISFSSENEGPDFLVQAGERKVWIECIACNKGEGADKVPPLQYGVVQDVPEDEMCIRIAHALKTKKETYDRYRKQERVGNSDPLVIAVNAGALGHPETNIPLLMKCVFGIHHQTVTIPKDGGAPRLGWSYRDFIEKKNESKVSVTFFFENENASISAALYCRNNVLNHSADLGQDIVVIHNPFAANPLPQEVFVGLKNYKMDQNGDIAL